MTGEWTSLTTQELAFTGPPVCRRNESGGRIYNCSMTAPGTVCRTRGPYKFTVRQSGKREEKIVTFSKHCINVENRRTLC